LATVSYFRHSTQEPLSMPKESLGRYITTISRHLQAFINKRLEPYNIAAGQFLFFITIYHYEGLSQDELSDMVEVDKITTSKMVKKLVEKGYIRKENNPWDRRFFRLYPTDKGREIFPIVRRVLDETTEILSSGFTQEEEQQVRALLPRMLSNIAQYTRVMKTTQEFLTKIDAFKTTIAALPDVQDAVRIQQTATRLENLHFTPTLMLPVAGFLYFSKTDMLAEIDRVAALTEQDIHEQNLEVKEDTQDIKLEQIGMLVYHFKLLTRLRQDLPEAWDEIDELYGDD
jgi:DNA-binding MarR family transcriptional regulator